MIPRLILIGGQYVDPTKVVAILTPTSHHVPLTDGADIQLRSVLVLDRNVQPLVPTAANPRTAYDKIMGWYEEQRAWEEERAAVWKAHAEEEHAKRLAELQAAAGKK